MLLKVYKILFTILPLFLAGILSAQQLQVPEEDAASQSLLKPMGTQERRTGIHDGNLVYTRFSNYGNLGSRYEPPKMEWPKGSGTWYGFEFIMIAGAEVVDSAGNTIHIMSENYTNPGSFDISPDGTHTYGWEPLPGYFNTGPENEDNYPAMSHKPETWPEHWPYDYPGVEGSRDGLWNGEFGSYVRADQESYYVMDDRNNDEFDYFPFVGSSEDSMDFPVGRRGLGLEVKVRGYQWAQVEAEDILIVRYDIANVSDKDLDKVVFGMYVDPAVGGEGDSQDDNAYFDKVDDITYCWDIDGIDNKGRAGVGYFGYAFLESPGDPLNAIDDDEDGLIDERQDNDRGTFGLSDIGNFGDAVEHWSGDEDGDWRPYADLNQNGIWDDGEAIFDDMGSDGIGPYDQDYPGPDSDGSEGNGMPDQGEPNFGYADNDESDQIGLTSFILRPAGNISDDETTWNEMIPDYFGGALPGNLAFIYGSGYFELPKTETRKFAITNLFGNDFDDILRNKRTMQKIYDADYSFAKPPLKPELKAVAGNQKVVLTWDDRAEESIDPIYGKDFEGYLVYRSTDPSFNSIKTITDSYGNSIFWEPIAQFDLANGLTGPHPIPIGESGAHFNMGNDTGLKYSYVDTTVENGRTYYYAVCAYDQGYDLDFYDLGISPLSNLAPGPPSECGKNIQTDLLGNVTATDRNTAVVVPNAPSAGYTDAELTDGVVHTGLATGKILVEPVAQSEVKDNHVYNISFTDTTEARFTQSITITDATENKVVYYSDTLNQVDIQSRLIDGLQFTVANDSAEVISTEWTVGDNMPVDVFLLDSPKSLPVPEDFEVRVKTFGVDTSFNPLAFMREPVNFEVWSITTNTKYDFLFDEPVNNDGMLNSGDEIVVAFNARGFAYNTAWRLIFGDTTGAVIQPAEGDVFQFKVSKPFNSDDAYTFNTEAAGYDEQKAKNDLNNIYVVPDPYVVTASWEKPLFYSSGRGERRIDFVNLPARCTIRIFNMSGTLVKTIKRESTMDSGAESWDLTTEDGLTVSYGIYVYHVDAYELGDKTGKFALIK